MIVDHTNETGWSDYVGRDTSSSSKGYILALETSLKTTL